jgi:2-dehydro-3-deoxygluconokinase
MIELREDAQAALAAGFAGDTLNTATYLRRLLPVTAFDVGYVTAIGDDHLSARMLAGWQAEGIDTALVQKRVGQLPGLYWIRTDAGGERAFFYWRSESAARAMLADGHAQRIARSLQQHDLLYLSGISLAILSTTDREGLVQLIEELHGRGIHIAYDCNFRARLWPVVDDIRGLQRRLLPLIDTCITSFADESAVFGDKDIEVTAERLAGAGVREWVVRGEPGETISSGGGHQSAAIAAPDEVIDTTGAGDSFDAAYLAARLSGYDVSDAVRAAHALAGIVVRQRGAIISGPATPPLDALVAVSG